MGGVGIGVWGVSRQWPARRCQEWGRRQTEGAPLWAHNIIAQVVCDGHDSGVERREAVGARSAVHEMGGGPAGTREGNELVGMSLGQQAPAARLLAGQVGAWGLSWGLQHWCRLCITSHHRLPAASRAGAAGSWGGGTGAQGDRGGARGRPWDTGLAGDRGGRRLLPPNLDWMPNCKMKREKGWGRGGQAGRRAVRQRAGRQSCSSAACCHEAACSTCALFRLSPLPNPPFHPSDFHPPVCPAQP